MPTTIECITARCCQVDEQLAGLPTHPEARRWPWAVVTVGLVQALTGVGYRPCSRWLTRDDRPLLPPLPARTRLVRLRTTHQDWTRAFLATPTVLGVIDTSGLDGLDAPARLGSIHRRAPWHGRR
jgi:hypothetical protein